MGSLCEQHPESPEAQTSPPRELRKAGPEVTWRGLRVQDVIASGFETKDSQTRALFPRTASLGKPCCPSASKVARHLLPRIRAPLCAGRAVLEARALPRGSLLQRQRQRLPEVTPGLVSGASAKLLMVAAAQCDFRGWETHTQAPNDLFPHWLTSAPEAPPAWSSGDLCSCYCFLVYAWPLRKAGN